MKITPTNITGRNMNINMVMAPTPSTIRPITNKMNSI